ncbi:MAG: TolC family protein [Candidatus Omnitrophica bacterium]|nr:TolC family protein [Candidatus Omnitrophota bacterium]
MIRNIFIITLAVIHIFSLSSRADETEEIRDILYLSIEDVSALALYNNLDIQIARLDAYIKRADDMITQSIFDTILSGHIRYTDDQLGRTSTIFGSKAITSEKNIGLEKKLPTGTTLGIEAEDVRSFSNSTFASLNPSHDVSLEFSIKQSLGKNFFGLIDRGDVKITKLQIKASDYSSLGKIEQYLSSAQKAYWKLVLRKEELRIKKEMLEKAQELASIYKNKYSVGLVEDPEIFAIDTLVLKRESDLLTAYDLLNLAGDDLLLEINADDESFDMDIRTEDELLFLPEKKDLIQALKIAIDNRRDYKEEKVHLEKKDINLEMKKNNLWPEIDLDASFKRNGVDSNFGTAAKLIGEEDNPESFIGISFSLPLENRDARGKLKQAQLEKAKQIVLLKKVEKKIVSELHDKVKQVNIAIGKTITSKRIVSLEAKKLAAENLRFGFGRSDSDTLISYHEDVLNAKLSLVQSIYDYQEKLIDLDVACNTLLDKYWKDEL